MTSLKITLTLTVCTDEAELYTITTGKIVSEINEKIILSVIKSLKTLRHIVNDIYNM